MSYTAVEQTATNPKAEEWAERIATQQRSGISVKQFCKERGLTEYSFYAWRKRLQEKGPVRFALVERSALQQERTTGPVLELVLAIGERLRIGTGADWFSSEISIRQAIKKAKATDGVHKWQWKLGLQSRGSRAAGLA
jgi:hypothetical protein